MVSLVWPLCSGSCGVYLYPVGFRVKGVEQRFRISGLHVMLGRSFQLISKMSPASSFSFGVWASCLEKYQCGGVWGHAREFSVWTPARICMAVERGCLHGGVLLVVDSYCKCGPQCSGL